MLDVTDGEVIDADFEVIEDNEPSVLINRNNVFPSTIIVDSREQSPYHFTNISPWSIVPLSHVALATGDYSLIGYQSRITIERKSISDFLGSISAGRERFEREFERMSQMEFAAVVVEGELSDVLNHAKAKTRMNTDSILGTVRSWSIRYGVHFFFCMGRRHAEIETIHLLYQFWRNEQKRFKELLSDPK